jgi:hypothetical protein
MTSSWFHYLPNLYKTVIYNSQLNYNITKIIQKINIQGRH